MIIVSNFWSVTPLVMVLAVAKINTGIASPIATTAYTIDGDINLDYFDFDSSEEGINICDIGVGGCLCDFRISPAEILCQATGLRLMYEQSDWLTTFEGNNISSDTSLSVRFGNNALATVSKFSPMAIVTLILRKNNISVIEDCAFAKLKVLATLDLSYNNLTSGSITEMTFMGQYNNESGGYFPLPILHLNLSHNRIGSLNKAAFEPLILLKSLDLSHNPLQTLSGSTALAISDLRNLERLGLARTMVDSIPDGTMLYSLPHLNSLDLSGNEFINVPEELRYTHHLQHLKLDKNKFEFLDSQSFLGLEFLKELSLNGNENLKAVRSGTFGGLKSLKKLSMSDCKRLDTISDAAFFGLVNVNTVGSWNLSEIILKGNSLSAIWAGLAPWDYIEHIDIRNNPFWCDCRLEWMVTELVPKIEESDPFLTKKDLVCAGPEGMRGRSLLDLGNEPDLFTKCKSSREDTLLPEEISNPPSPSATTKKVEERSEIIVVVAIGILFVAFGVSILVLCFVLMTKRRANVKRGFPWKFTLIPPTELRLRGKE